MALLTFLARLAARWAGPWGAAVTATVAAAVLPAAAQGQDLTQDEALRLAFPGAHAFDRRTAYLDDAELERVRAEAGDGVEVESAVVTHYVALAEDGSPLGAAYFDAHRVRTLPEVLMIVVGTDDRIRRIEVLRFAEPPEYEAPGGWLAQFEGRRLDAELSLKGGIVNITGATLTAGAVTEAARRTLAFHRVIGPFAPGGS